MCEERWWRLVKYLSQKSQGYTTSPLAARDTLRMVRPLARFCCWCGSKPEIMEPVVVQVSMEETDVTSERSSVSIRRLRENQSKYET